VKRSLFDTIIPQQFIIKTKVFSHGQCLTVGKIMVLAEYMHMINLYSVLKYIAVTINCTTSLTIITLEALSG